MTSGFESTSVNVEVQNVLVSRFLKAEVWLMSVCTSFEGALAKLLKLFLKLIRKTILSARSSIWDSGLRSHRIHTAAFSIKTHFRTAASDQRLTFVPRWAAKVHEQEKQDAEQKSSRRFNTRLLCHSSSTHYLSFVISHVASRKRLFFPCNTQR